MKNEFIPVPIVTPAAALAIIKEKAEAEKKKRADEAAQAERERQSYETAQAMPFLEAFEYLFPDEIPLLKAAGISFFPSRCHAGPLTGYINFKYGQRYTAIELSQDKHWRINPQSPWQPENTDKGIFWEHLEIALLAYPWEYWDNNAEKNIYFNNPAEEAQFFKTAAEPVRLTDNLDADGSFAFTHPDFDEENDDE